MDTAADIATLVDKIHDAWNSLMDKIQEVFEPVVFMLSNLGSPLALTSTGDAWSSQVGGSVSGKVGMAEPGALAVDDSWTGSAATQYLQQVPRQKTALQNIKTQVTDGISSALKDVATGIQFFFTAMVIAIVAWIAAIVTAIASSATVIGIPAGIFIAVGAGVAFGAAFWGAGENPKSQCRTAKSILEQKLAENTRYPSGSWPQATL